jgi:hypothetical protein
MARSRIYVHLGKYRSQEIRASLDEIEDVYLAAALPEHRHLAAAYRLMLKASKMRARTRRTEFPLRELFPQPDEDLKEAVWELKKLFYRAAD